MNLRQREPRRHDAAHLAFVRSQPCCVCPKGSNRPSEAAHIRMPCPARGKPPTGMQEKPADMWTVPLCGYHHRTGPIAQHKMGEAEFWELVGRDPFAIALKLWALSGGEARAAEPAPTKKPRKIKPRDPDRPRRKILSNPKIKSRGFQKKRAPDAQLDQVRVEIGGSA